MEIWEIRKKIDAIDFQMVKLLDNRMELALRIRKLKDNIYDPAREDQVIENVVRYSKGVIRPEFMARIYREIMAESKLLQSMNLKLAGFQGEHGAYGEVAVRNYDVEFIPIPCLEFFDVFEGVASGKFDTGIVPVENSLEGAVTSVNDLLVETDLKIIGEITIPITHYLLTLPGVELSEIKTVYSHPQALAQCRKFLGDLRVEQLPFYDTAGAAKMLSEKQPGASAAIASKLAAEIYNLEILKENIEDHASNRTRFVVLSRESVARNGNKSSIIFSTKHKAGTLYGVLQIFAEAGINLTRIESRPVRNDPGTFAFLLDFKGSDKDEKIGEVLEKVKMMTSGFKFLGCYKEFKSVE